jgi:VWFA-related protein
MALLGLPMARAQAPQQPSSQSPQSSSAPAKGNSDSDFDVTPGQAPNSEAQPGAGGGNTILRTGSTLVLVPALVKTKKGDPVFTLTADNFVVTDDGIEQKVRLEEDSGSQPLALVIVVETGGDGAKYLDDYHDLGTLLESMVGNVRHRVAVVSFDSEPELVQNFNHDFDLVETTLNQLEPGDNGDATLDALGYAVDMLRKQPPSYRRAILLLSETVDHGSHIKIEDALRVLSDTNTSIYSIAFSSSRDEAKRDLGANAPHSSEDAEPGPPGGCMATDPDKPPQPGDSKLKQAWDCAGVLLPPLRLANLAAVAGRNGLRKNVPETVAKLSGGEYFSFKDTHGLDRALVALSNHIPNRYVLSFEPRSPHAGLHALGLRLKDNPDYVVTSRSSYWAEGDNGSVTSR